MQCPWVRVRVYVYEHARGVEFSQNVFFFFFHCQVRGVCIYMKACLHVCRHSSGCACACVVVSVEALRLTLGMGFPSLFRLSR